jgi:hypothetical protein
MCVRRLWWVEQQHAKTGEWEWKNEKAELLLVVAEDDGITNVRVWSRRQG